MCLSLMGQGRRRRRSTADEEKEEEGKEDGDEDYERTSCDSNDPHHGHAYVKGFYSETTQTQEQTQQAPQSTRRHILPITSGSTKHRGTGRRWREGAGAAAKGAGEEG